MRFVHFILFLIVSLRQLTRTVEDFADWTNWILYKSGRGLDVRESWETWWNNEQVKKINGKVHY